MSDIMEVDITEFRLYINFHRSGPIPEGCHIYIYRGNNTCSRWAFCMAYDDDVPTTPILSTFSLSMHHQFYIYKFTGSI